MTDTEPTDWWHREYLGGNRFAAHMALLEAWRSKTQVPEWAMDEVARLCWQDLNGHVTKLIKRRPRFGEIWRDLLSMFDIKPNPGGRGQSIADSMDKYHLVAIVEAVKQLHPNNTAGDNYELAQQVLLELGVPYEVGSVEERYGEWREAYQPHPSQMPIWTSIVEDAEVEIRRKQRKSSRRK